MKMIRAFYQSGGLLCIACLLFADASQLRARPIEAKHLVEHSNVRGLFSFGLGNLTGFVSTGENDQVTLAINNTAALAPTATPNATLAAGSTGGGAANLTASSPVGNMVNTTSLGVSTPGGLVNKTELTGLASSGTGTQANVTTSSQGANSLVVEAPPIQDTFAGDTTIAESANEPILGIPSANSTTPISSQGAGTSPGVPLSGPQAYTSPVSPARPDLTAGGVSNESKSVSETQISPVSEAVTANVTGITSVAGSDLNQGSPEVPDNSDANVTTASHIIPSATVNGGNSTPIAGSPGLPTDGSPAAVGAPEDGGNSANSISGTVAEANDTQTKSGVMGVTIVAQENETTSNNSTNTTTAVQAPKEPNQTLATNSSLAVVSPTSSPVKATVAEVPQKTHSVEQVKAAETKSPTLSPTLSPTKPKTEQPTSSPTIAPTKDPTSSPTQKPTKIVTEQPTTSPTRNPTPLPTSGPTKVKTDKPTLNPTPNPTPKPTKAKTGKPTPIPTPDPTSVPTHVPTKSPSKSPIKKEAPPINETNNPTKSPSRIPTKIPTVKPTKAPIKTVSPTNKQTKNPTHHPTVNPTKDPSNSPTKAPTPKKTEQEEKKPETNPPTKNPTKSPTESPTKNHTDSPVKDPTASPTKTPTKAPTKNPSPSPTKAPMQPMTKDSDQATTQLDTSTQPSEDQASDSNCGNGICEPEFQETCETCAQDCIGGTNSATVCGNGWCEDGENCDSCPRDCPSRVDDTTGNQFCCQGGPLLNVAKAKQDSKVIAVGCNNNLCFRNRGCSAEPAVDVGFCCGNGSCEPGEHLSTCPDCSCNNDAVCDLWEIDSDCPDCKSLKTEESTCLQAMKVCRGINPDPCCNGCGDNGRCK